MSKQQSRFPDQAERLRKKTDERIEEKEPALPPASRGTLPPRSSVHPKLPPLSKIPFYIGGIVLLAAVVGGGGYWWHAASKNSPSTAPAQVATEAKNTAPPVNEKPADKNQAAVTPTPQPPAPAKQAAPAPVPAKPAAQPVPAAKPPVSAPAVKPPAPAVKPPAPAVKPPAPAVKPPAPAVKPPAPAVKRPAPAVVQSKKAEPAVKRKNRVLRHRVQPGDTLFRISMMYYETGKYQTYLARYNHVRNTGNILVGTIIKVPVPPR
ncbi:LysM peptidoglycan-binding domain-containing protein [Aneurinibacillus tyrosinisolvens]|uniref:LysM peptidoglycan-binding domain-containing protein n=1 Tax=Aneurinibacillus tyrosinisolvens TaxID=1443435 RepID=UPI000699A4DE|nr:LysM peptidoglycan-binding domain-containing protein [Aneurinibacillus tyrosinisolvens]